MNLIDDLIRGRLTETEAEAIFEQAIADLHAGKADPRWWDTLGLVEPETTLIMHGASVAEAARFRGEGWPVMCASCGLRLDSDDEWSIDRSLGGYGLRHLVCPEAG